MKASFVPAALVSLALSASGAVHAVTLGQTDTFSGGPEGWFAGGGPMGQVPPTPPTVVAGGGPAGAGDSFLQLTANGGNGPGGRLVGMNASQWAGDYSAAGVGAIEMDLRNLGTVDLTLRLFFEDPAAGPPLNAALTQGVLLPAGSDWTHVVFPILPGALAVLQGDAATLLTNTTVLRIVHAVDAAFPPSPVAGALGIDNIQATPAIPEPASVALMAAGLGVVAWWAKRRRRAD